MSTVTQRACLRSLVLVALGVISPDALAGQLVSARPASVGLTVVVPPRQHSDAAVVSEGQVSLIRATPTVIDLETRVGMPNWPAARIEVRLGPTWSTQSTHVWVRNRLGEFERLQRDTSVVTLDAPPSLGGMQSPIRFRLESIEPRTSPTVISLEYRLRVGGGDEFSVWTVPSLLRVERGADQGSARE